MEDETNRDNGVRTRGEIYPLNIRQARYAGDVSCPTDFCKTQSFAERILLKKRNANHNPRAYLDVTARHSFPSRSVGCLGTALHFCSFDITATLTRFVTNLQWFHPRLLDSRFKYFFLLQVHIPKKLLELVPVMK